MAKKRKGRSSAPAQTETLPHDTFPDSEDEFFAGKDRILLDEGPSAKRRRKLEQEMEELQPSDEEVLVADGLSDEEDRDELDDQDEDSAGQNSDEEDEDDTYWGDSKADYYNADAIETEADAMEEEAEARRLHQKQLKRMTDADFGFDELEWKDDAEAGQSKGRVLEKLPPLQIPDDATDEERMAMLRTRYPEFEPLSDDLLDVHRIHQDLKRQDFKSRVVQTKIRASGAYMAAIAMYLAILTSNTDGLALPPAELRDHPVMNSLLRCRQLWESVRDMEETVQIDIDEPLPKTIAEKPVYSQSTPGMSATKKSTRKTQRPPSPSISSDLDDLDGLAPLPALPSGRKTKKPKATSITDLLSAAASAPAADHDSASDFGDELPLTSEEAAEKARKKKSLRFYTAQIAQKATKRGAKSREAGGDDDVPYKERIKDKQARLEREAAKTAAAQPDPAQDNFESDADDSDDGIAQGMNDDANDYYNEITSKSTAKKADKLARSQAHALAAEQGAQVYEKEVVGPDGKRRITYAIEKNKGLTPKRKKDVRNPRVKKKKQYESKMKKYKSMRPTYKGGEGRGGYGGELTGIKTNLVKSVKL